MYLTPPPNAEIQSRIKAVGLLTLAEMGVLNVAELSRLAAGHVDEVLDRLFEHCGMLRVRVTDDDYLCITPRGTVQ